MDEQSGRRSNRGFAAMDREQQRRIASAGGRAAHERGSAHEFSADEAREAGRKGGRTVSQNRAHMALIGRRGGMARGEDLRNEAARRAAGGSQDSQASQGSASAPTGDLSA